MFISSILLSIVPIYAYNYGMTDLTILMTLNTLNSLNYWRYPLHGFRRNFDIICSLFTYAVHYYICNMVLLNDKNKHLHNIGYNYKYGLFLFVGLYMSGKKNYKITKI